MSPGVAGQIAVKNRSHSVSAGFALCGSELDSRCSSAARHFCRVLPPGRSPPHATR